MNSNLYTSQVQKDLSLFEKEKVMLVGVNCQNDEVFYYQMTELKSLCEAAGYEVIETITQNLSNINPQTYIGSGKLLEIKQYLEIEKICKVVFNDELTPSQIKNIKDVLDEAVIIDRTMLILEIFEKRATTKEASLQVEVAKLKYMLPRLIGLHQNLSRTGGTSSGAGMASRGLGETKLELDKRHIEAKIVKAKAELEEIKKARQTSRKLRNDSDIKRVALVGYTNAGKSSMINALLKMFPNFNENKEVFVKDMLFATLETQTRKIKLPNNHQFLLTDTVGFISKLPHHLVESFKSTLEEILEADLIIHLVDGNSPFRDLQIKTTTEVLESLGASAIPSIMVINKCDLVRNMITLTNTENAVFVSVKLKEGLRDLVQKIDDTLYDDLYLDTFLLPFDKGNFLSVLKETSEVLNLEYINEGIKVTAKVNLKLHNMLSEYIINE